MTSIKISDEVMALVAYQANVDSVTVKEAAERLLIQGYNRLRSLEKWRRKEKIAKKAIEKAPAVVSKLPTKSRARRVAKAA